MELAPYVEALEGDLAAIAAVGDEATGEAAHRLSAALELNAQLPSGRVEIRLAGQDPSFLYVADAGSAPPAAEEGTTARITLRLPESLKTSIETAAAREGVSVNAWLVRALARSVSTTTQSRGSGNRLRGFGRS